MFGRRRTARERHDDTTNGESASGDDLLNAAPQSAESESTGADAGSQKTGGWRGVFRGNRGLWVTAVVAILALVGGLLLGRFVISPLDAAAGDGAPEPGLVTVPVEYGELSNDVTIRGEVAYADAVEVTLSGGSSETGGGVITGQVPDVGSELDTLSVAMEVGGRPVIVLPGELPAYRDLVIGASGPDVVQLKEALQAAGLNPGDAESNTYDEATANAVGELYAQAGYSGPEGTAEAEEVLTGAEEGVRAAQSSLDDARAALHSSQGGPSASDIKAADNAIAALQRQIWAAEGAEPRDEVTIGDLHDQLALAHLQRQELDAPRDTSAEQAGVASAEESLAAANDRLAEARQGVLPTLPASEVLFLDELPRRVDAVNVERGGVLEGAAMTVSGATVKLSGSIASADADLLEEGLEASFELPDGTMHTATISAIREPSEGDRWTVELEPAELTPDQLQQVQGTNVRVDIPVGATDGEVLSVPYAALTAGPGGESRVEVVEGDPRDGEDAETRLVVVETGLAAGGYVEVRPTEGDLTEGDLVVVGS